MLYPLKFKPQFKEKIWGGRKLETFLNKKIPSGKLGESWEISGVQGSLSVVANGVYAGNNIQEMAEIFMAELLGERVYRKFGIEFPLLLKFIDAAEDLSVQVHPDDETAYKRHKAYGKTEMWYILQADTGAELISGFSKNTDAAEYMKALKNRKVIDLLNFVPVKKGDVFFIPPGRVHTIGKNILLTEIQQTSDITYRIYDWGRTDSEGKMRELHIAEATDVLDFRKTEQAKTQYEFEGKSAQLSRNDYFTANLLKIDSPVEKDYFSLDSFVIFVCTSGALVLEYPEGKEKLTKGETVLLPAEIPEIRLIPESCCELLEIFIEPENLQN